MKLRLFTAIVFTALAFGLHPALAFTAENGGGYANSDGTSKFSDPDEQLDESNPAVNTFKFGDSGAMRFDLQQGNDTTGNTSSRSALH
jgi:hypothetical protein